MNQQPDKLFREKLDSYHKTASSAAWERIAAAQPKKTNKGLWLKIAASILLLATATYLLWVRDDKPGAQQNILTETSSEQPGEMDVPQDTQHRNALLEREVKDEPVAKTEKPSRKRRKAKVTPLQEATSGQETNPEVTVSLTTPEEIDDRVLPTESSETVIGAAQVEPAPESETITLVFTAKEVNEYLDKKALAQATSDEKKPSTLKKLLKKANDLKNNQDPFGELRQRKNEILALNFKSEKQRGQNK